MTAEAPSLVPTSCAEIPQAPWIGYLPAVPSRLLVLSASPSSDAAKDLAELGFAIQQISLCEIGNLAQRQTSTRSQMFQVDIALPKSEQASFHGALVLGLAPSVHPLALFDQLSNWLVDGAVVVLTGAEHLEFTYRVPNWLQYVFSIALRMGYTEEKPGNGTILDPSNGQFVRVLRRTSTPRWQLRHVRQTDFDHIAGLFVEVFGEPLSRELWHWKYGDGRGNAVIAAKHGELVAHYGGIYREIRLRGTVNWAFQICDVMVHPKERGVMTRQGPFLLTAATSAEIYGPLGFGFPNLRAMQVAEKMGLYSEVGRMVSLRWRPSAPGYRVRTRARALKQDDEADHKRVNALWQAMAHDLRDDVVGVRDWQYIEGRYCRHPHHHYEILMITERFTGRAIGIAVLRRFVDYCELLDLVLPFANLSRVIDQVRRIIGVWGLPTLYGWVAENQAHRFAKCEAEIGELNVSIPTSSWTHDSRADLFKDRWWLMSGDTDFR